MKLNDPFGRMARRREREYESLKQALLKANMTDAQKAADLRDNLAKRSKTGLMVVIPIIVIMALVFREYAIFALAFGVLAILWLTNTSRRGQEYINRYIAEECGQPTDTEAEAEPAALESQVDDEPQANEEAQDKAQPQAEAVQEATQESSESSEPKKDSEHPSKG
ncbi:hypothetical protein [Marinobacterium lutimaris]|uniref:Uncharacterized protein n=1 Tax=Marinobacterium lutimaris TaxID=568106 RepID=A0A1H5YZ30_9GAMM|nr:hypothetical protein [Marinobacterium lutimaris]SEG29271.1 hypothetical protein SAMN05444390_1011950 [Marinobacterium lutimaris]